MNSHCILEESLKTSFDLSRSGLNLFFHKFALRTLLILAISHLIVKQLKSLLDIFMKAFFEKYPFIDYIYLPRCGGVLKSSSDFKISIKSVEDL